LVIIRTISLLEVDAYLVGVEEAEVEVDVVESGTVELGVAVELNTAD
jgi:hypothetical protein